LILLDTNIFLELLQEEKHAEKCEILLEHISKLGADVTVSFDEHFERLDVPESNLATCY
jgi:predicted nucleic acid-binding protein